MAELHDGFEPRGRLWLVMTPELGGHHDGTRAEVGHRSGKYAKLVPVKTTYRS